jgi:hypothetical protein
VLLSISSAGRQSREPPGPSPRNAGPNGFMRRPAHTRGRIMGAYAWPHHGRVHGPGCGAHAPWAGGPRCTLSSRRSICAAGGRGGGCYLCKSAGRRLVACQWSGGGGGGGPSGARGLPPRGRRGHRGHGVALLWPPREGRGGHRVVLPRRVEPASRRRCRALTASWCGRGWVVAGARLYTLCSGVQWWTRRYTPVQWCTPVAPGPCTRLYSVHPCGRCRTARAVLVLERALTARQGSPPGP